MNAKVYVTLKSGVLDPQGKAVQGALARAGYDTIESVRIGKVIEVKLKETDRALAEAELKEICDEMLANPVMEDFRIEIED